MPYAFRTIALCIYIFRMIALCIPHDCPPQSIRFFCILQFPRLCALAEAAEAGMVNLKGHRSVGGIRASAYNALPVDSVRTLVEFMDGFRSANS